MGLQKGGLFTRTRWANLHLGIRTWRSSWRAPGAHGKPSQRGGPPGLPALIRKTERKPHDRHRPGSAALYDAAAAGTNALEGFQRIGRYTILSRHSSACDAIHTSSS